MTDLPGTVAEIAAFVSAFEAGTLPKERWSHGAHLLAGAWYVHGLGEAEATQRMRERVSAYNLAVGGKNTQTGGYHERITVFWIKLLARFCREHPDLDRAAFAHETTAHFAPQRSILAEFYGFDVVNSLEARRRWVEPTLQRLD